MRKFLQSPFLVAALLATTTASAQQAGDNVLSIGLASINPNANLGPLTNTGGLTALLSGATAHVSSETTVSFGWLHMFTDQLGVEATIGLPPRVNQGLNAAGANHPDAARFDVWTPTVVGKYFFGTPQDAWRPYLGLGVSHASFHDIRTNPNDPTIRTLSGTSAKLSSSFTPLYNAGLVYRIDDRWSLNGSVSYLPIRTDATFAGAGGTTTGRAKLDTIDYVIRLGYRF
ncbi:MAG: hypothetical protein RJA36_2504 [Pseudomonadota bacterium]|jgi:outer membrane protein